MTSPSPEMKPILYLDVDGMLLRHPDQNRFVSVEEFEQYWAENRGGGPANGVREFLEWATTHCECRWLTAWGVSGAIDDPHLIRLAGYLRVPVELLARVKANPLSWNGDKTQGINFEEGREWFWLDDETMGRELLPLRARGCENRLVKTDSSRDPDALLKSWAFIRERLESRVSQSDSTEKEYQRIAEKFARLLLGKSEGEPLDYDEALRRAVQSPAPEGATLAKLWKLIDTFDATNPEKFMRECRELRAGSGEDQTAAATEPCGRAGALIGWICQLPKGHAGPHLHFAAERRCPCCGQPKDWHATGNVEFDAVCAELEDARAEIASLKQQVIDSALRAERLEADRMALLEGHVRLRLSGVFDEGPWIAEGVVDNTGDYLNYPTAKAALDAYRATLSPQPAAEGKA